MPGLLGYNFETKYPGDDSDQVWFILAQRFQRRRFLKKFTLKNAKIGKNRHFRGNNSKLGKPILPKISGFVDLVLLIISSTSVLTRFVLFQKFLPKKKFNPYVLFLVTAAMLFGPRTSRIQFRN